MRNLYRALLAGAMSLMVVLGSSGAALAATNETLTVNATMSLSGVPSSLSFGANAAGTTATATQFTAVYSANGTATVDANQTDLTAGASTLAKGNVKLSIDGGAAIAADGATIATLSAGGGSGSKTIDASVDIPAAQAAGAYTGTLTIAIH